jgi:hypothetical protein
MVHPVEEQVHNGEDDRNHNRCNLVAELTAVARGREVDGQDVQGNGEHHEEQDDQKDGKSAGETREASQGRCCGRQRASSGYATTTTGRVVVVRLDGTELFAQQGLDDSGGVLHNPMKRERKKASGA